MLRFKFDNQYPIASPAVTFVVNPEYQAPLHPVRRVSFVHRIALLTPQNYDALLYSLSMSIQMDTCVLPFVLAPCSFDLLC